MASKTQRLLSILAISLLAGCSSKPSDSDAALHLNKTVACGGDCPVINLVRTNGWEEGSDYKTEYAYDVSAKYGYDAFVLKVAAELEANMVGGKMPAAEQANWKRLVAAAIMDPATASLEERLARDAIKRDGGEFLLAAGFDIYNGVLSDQLASYIRDAGLERKAALLFGLTAAKTLGYKPATKPGDILAHNTVQLVFHKTEKGWLVKQ